MRNQSVPWQAAEIGGSATPAEDSVMCPRFAEIQNARGRSRMSGGRWQQASTQGAHGYEGLTEVMGKPYGRKRGSGSRLSLSKDRRARLCSGLHVT